MMLMSAHDMQIAAELFRQSYVELEHQLTEERARCASLR